MQPCQRRTIGGTEGRGGRVILATHPSSTHLCLSSALHLIPFPVYAVIARPGGDIGVRMDRHKRMRLFASPSPFLSIYLSISSNPLSLATTCAHTHTRARIYSLSLSLRCDDHPSLSGVSAHPARLWFRPAQSTVLAHPWLYTTPLRPCAIRFAFVLREKRETVYGRRVTRETWRNWQEGITDIGQRRIAMGYLLPTPSSISTRPRLAENRPDFTPGWLPPCSLLHCMHNFEMLMELVFFLDF